VPEPGDIHAAEHHHRQAHVGRPAAHRSDSAVACTRRTSPEPTSSTSRSRTARPLRRQARRRRRPCGPDRGEHPIHDRPRQRVARRSTRRSRPVARPHRRPCASAADAPAHAGGRASSTRSHGRDASRSGPRCACPWGRDVVGAA
jgi:hypothetical protein